MMQATITIAEVGDMDDDLKPLVDTASGDDFAEVEVLVSATVGTHDYGVPRSPTWCEIDEFTIEEVVVNGVSTPWSKFQKEWSETVCDTIRDIVGKRLTVEDLH